MAVFRMRYTRWTGGVGGSTKRSYRKVIDAHSRGDAERQAQVEWDSLCAELPKHRPPEFEELIQYIPWHPRVPSQGISPAHMLIEGLPAEFRIRYTHSKSGPSGTTRGAYAKVFTAATLADVLVLAQAEWNKLCAAYPKDAQPDFEELLQSIPWRPKGL